jgi:hypothetical protein
MKSCPATEMSPDIRLENRKIRAGYMRAANGNQIFWIVGLSADILEVADRCLWELKGSPGFRFLKENPVAWVTDNVEAEVQFLGQTLEWDVDYVAGLEVWSRESTEASDEVVRRIGDYLLEAITAGRIDLPDYGIVPGLWQVVRDLFGLRRRIRRLYFGPPPPLNDTPLGGPAKRLDSNQPVE